MKNYVKKCMHVLSIMGLLASLNHSLNACGSSAGWFNEFFGLDDVFVNYITIEGQDYISDVVQQIIDSLISLYKNNPEAFNAFIQACLTPSSNQLPQNVLVLLKAYGLVEDDNTIGDFVKFIVSWTVEVLDDGSVKIWSIDELIKDGYATLSKKRQN